MAQLKPKLTLNWELQCTLNEEEAKALEAIFCYGVDAFLKVFYQHLGKSYMEPCEEGLRSLEEATRTQLGPQLYELEAARKAMIKGMADQRRDWEQAEERRRVEAGGKRLNGP